MTNVDALPPELRRLIDAIDSCERDAESLIAGTTDDEVNWQERPGQTWSIAQCLDHLTMMNHFYVAPFLVLVNQARQRGGTRFNGLKSTAGGRWFIRSQEPPVRQRLRTPRQAVPRSALRREELVDGFKKSHEPYRALVNASADVDVNRVTGPNPFLPVIRMRVSTVLQIIPGHDRRHLWQAHNVKRALLRTNQSR